MIAIASRRAISVTRRASRCGCTMSFSAAPARFATYTRTRLRSRARPIANAIDMTSCPWYDMPGMSGAGKRCQAPIITDASNTTNAAVTAAAMRPALWCNSSSFSSASRATKASRRFSVPSYSLRARWSCSRRSGRRARSRAIFASRRARRPWVFRLISCTISITRARTAAIRCDLSIGGLIFTGSTGVGSLNVGAMPPRLRRPSPDWTA